MVLREELLSRLVTAITMAHKPLTYLEELSTHIPDTVTRSSKLLPWQKAHPKLQTFPILTILSGATIPGTGMDVCAILRLE